jgi:hypothetical protein
MNDELKKLEKDAYAALNCLYIAVDKEIADDVNEKVKAYINKLKSEIPVNSDYFETSTAQES